jgi:hypothetical protein
MLGHGIDGLTLAVWAIGQRDTIGLSSAISGFR